MSLQIIKCILHKLVTLVGCLIGLHVFIGYDSQKTDKIFSCRYIVTWLFLCKGAIKQAAEQAHELQMTVRQDQNAVEDMMIPVICGAHKKRLKSDQLSERHIGSCNAVKIKHIAVEFQFPDTDKTMPEAGLYRDDLAAFYRKE